MIKAILFDLDGTLLVNPMERFLPPYFQLLAEELAHLIPPQELVVELVRCTNHVIAHPDPERTNAEAFWERFTAATGLARAEVQPIIDRFYEERFPALASYTAPRPEARAVVQRAFERGYQVVIATNPVFPRRAIEHRLAWAGVPAEEFPYALITSYENMHACKPHAAYYREILEVIGRAPGEAIMVGDEGMDMAARAIGIRTFWVHDPVPKVPPPPLAERHGTLADFARLLEEGLSAWEEA